MQQKSKFMHLQKVCICCLESFFSLIFFLWILAVQDVKSRKELRRGLFFTFQLGSFINCVDQFLPFFDHLPPSVDIFYLINVDKKWTTYLPTSSCKRSLWTTPYFHKYNSYSISRVIWLLIIVQCCKRMKKK